MNQFSLTRYVLLPLIGLALLGYLYLNTTTSKDVAAASVVPTTAPSAKNTANMSVNQVAAEDANLSTLVGLIQAAELNEILDGEGPYTIFAPTNSAFEKLPEGTVENLKDPSNKEKLKAILLYHVVPGKVLSTDVKTAKVPTANGKELDIVVVGSEVKVNRGKVIKTDLEGKNGVIHEIDTVLLP